MAKLMNKQKNERKKEIWKTISKGGWRGLGFFLKELRNKAKRKRIELRTKRG